MPILLHVCMCQHCHRVLRLEERSSSQSARHRRQQKYQLTLLNAVKPHTKPVTSLTVDSEGKILASGSKDNTVFFLNVQDQYSPIGFINTPAAVTTMQWSSGKQVNMYMHGWLLPRAQYLHVFTSLLTLLLDSFAYSRCLFRLFQNHDIVHHTLHSCPSDLHNVHLIINFTSGIISLSSGLLWGWYYDGSGRPGPWPVWYV